MILAAHQPNYLPNIAFFNKMAQADRFVIFTNVQFSKGDGWVRRHKIQGTNKDIWLTVPVHSKEGDRIKDVTIDNSHHWWVSHKGSIRQTYAKTKEKDALDRLTRLYDTRYHRLADVNLSFILTLRDILGIQTPVVIDEEVTGAKQDLLVNLCMSQGADAYLSGMGGKEYMTDAYFASLMQRGITPYFVENDFTPRYPYTILHYLFTDGLAAVQDIVLRKTLRPTHIASPVHHAFFA